MASNKRGSHQFLPFEITFVRLLDFVEGFDTYIEYLNDLRMKYQYSSHFILDARYDYNFSNQVYGSRLNFTSFHLSIESAGNLLSGFSSLWGNPTDSIGVKELFGVPYSQYVRGTGEITRYFYHGNSSTLVLRALAGIGIPYGNSTAMPYEKSFFGGGPTTMRAWQLRRLGPGSFSVDNNRVERIGDLQLVLNLEERFRIVGIFEGAVFADMGNVWLFNPADDYPGGEFKLDRFLKDIAVGVGLGLRINVSIATLRLDFAIPVYDPGYSAPWRPSHWDFDQIVTNFGINYPF
jgi:hypothetical protein